MKFTQNQSEICKANRLCIAHGKKGISSAHTIQTKNHAFPRALPLPGCSMARFSS